MMQRKRIKLTTKVRAHTGDGHSTFRVPLTIGTSAQTLEPVLEADEPQFAKETLDQEPNLSLPEENHLHTNKKSSSEKWKAAQEDLLHTFFYNPQQTKCASCEKTVVRSHSTKIKCTDCGNHTHYCSIECCKKYHRGDLNPFHKPMQWEVSANKYIEANMNIQLIRTDHICQTQQTRHGIQVFDHLARTHNVSIVTCGCEVDAVTMFRHGLWPSTVDQPHIAFHVHLLDTLEFLMLEGKMSIHAFCQSMRWRNNLTPKQCETMYKALRGEPIGQYRYMKYHARNIVDDIENCPACPQDGDVFISLDGNFGLVRKKGKDTAQDQPNHANTMFLTMPDNVPESGSASTITQCSNFQAGNALRSQTRQSRLAVTGVFGSACRHGIPMAFIDMKEGERLYLSEMIINHLVPKLEAEDASVNVHIIYDIACKLEAHLRAKGDNRYNNIKLAVPSWHSYGHKASCQVQYSTRWQTGYGLTDGEVMERLWSFLRRFAFITKEMSPARRIDLLTDALMHYRRKKLCELDFTLQFNMDRAVATIESTSAQLQDHKYNLSIDMKQVDEIVQKQQDILTRAIDQDISPSEEEKYVALLVQQSQLRKSVATFMTTDTDKRETLQDQLSKVEKELRKMEKKLRIDKRWHTNDKNFKEHLKSSIKKKKLKLLKQMHDNAVEYQFMKSLKDGKHCGELHAKEQHISELLGSLHTCQLERNQKMAERMQKQIQRATRTIHKAVDSYNKSEFTGTCGGIPDAVAYTDMLDPHGIIYHHLEGIHHDIKIGDKLVSSVTRTHIAEIRIRHLRAQEEITILKAEMVALLTNLGAHHDKILTALSQEVPVNGMQVELVHKQEETFQYYHRARTLFAGYLGDAIPAVPDHMSKEITSLIIDRLIKENNVPVDSESELSDYEDAD